MPSREKAAFKLAGILRACVLAFAYQKTFDSREVLRILSQLSPEQAETGWVYALKAKAYFETVDYAMVKASFYFDRVICSGRQDV